MNRWIFWDWNGTLLDDVDYAIGVMNGLLRHRGLPLLPHADYYRSIYCFPVSEYYIRLGLDPALFVEDAHLWMDAYMAGEHVCPLRQGAEQALQVIRDAGACQGILTASKVENFHAQLRRFPIAHYFDAVLGLNHIYATSKVEVGRQFMADRQVDPRRACMIGDTLHDAETAREMGVACVLLLGGHQDRAQLEQAHVPIADSPAQAARMALTLTQGV